MFQETDALVVFFNKNEKNNELNFDTCGTQNPEDI